MLFAVMLAGQAEDTESDGCCVVFGFFCKCCITSVSHLFSGKAEFLVFLKNQSLNVKLDIQKIINGC